MHGMDKKQIIIILVLAAAIIFGTGYKIAQVRKAPVTAPVISGKQIPGKQIPGDANGQKKEPAKKLTVYICGAVKKPGVYSFDEGARIIEGIKAAEASKEAALEAINLAAVMNDGEQIYVPGKEEVLSGSAPSKVPQGIAQDAPNKGAAPNLSSIQTKININTAGKDEFDKLPGIGPSTAEKIIDYRKAHGRFKDITELTKVPGIGDKKFAKLRDKIRI